LLMQLVWQRDCRGVAHCGRARFGDGDGVVLAHSPAV
jgi:hypothetical protein